MRVPLLSICIPTYNRAIYLDNLLKNIVLQEWFSDDIEILIYSDPSSDNTNEIAGKYTNIYKNIRYHRNKERLGMIPSILDSIWMCRWKYIWLFSDDDIMAEKAIKIMIKTIKSELPSLILNKFIWFQQDDEINMNKISHSWNITSYTWLENYFNFLGDLNYSIDWYLMHCSLFCFQKDLYYNNLNKILKERWIRYMDNLKKDYFAHIRIIYLPFGNEKKITVIEKNLVLLRWWNISWKFVFKTCKDFWDLVSDLTKVYKINIKTYIKMKILYFYSVFTYVVIVHIQKCIPKTLYEILIKIWKRLVRIIKIG